MTSARIEHEKLEIAREADKVLVRLTLAEAEGISRMVEVEVPEWRAYELSRRLVDIAHEIASTSVVTRDDLRLSVDSRPCRDCGGEPGQLTDNPCTCGAPR